jgi:CubicO group peptidase (beta-lactamase class C family)
MKRYRHLLLLLPFAGLSLACAGTSPSMTTSAVVAPVGVQDPVPSAAPEPAPEPIWDWPVATPEEEGMDSGKLADLLEEIQAQGDPIDSVLVVRHGRVVLDAYVDPFRKDLRHELYSCTKSVLSMLVGIAIQEGKIAGVQAPVLDFFPGRTIAHLDGRKRDLRLEHLLTMSPGFEWAEKGVPHWAPRNSGTLMAYSSDPVQFVLDTPVIAEPGTRFTYNSGGSQLLASILEQSTGMDLLAFARERLFGPLGITDVSWKVTHAGNHAGGGGLQMKPRDLARLGELYLKGGTWNGRRIVPQSWIRESVRPRIAASEDTWYGYHWWIPAGGSYAARGFGDQILWVLPDLQMVIVMTGGSARSLARPLAYLFILPAVQGTESLPPNPGELARLQARIREVAQPQPRPVPPLPPKAGEVAGKVWEMEENSLGWRSLSLHFETSDAVLDLGLERGDLKLPIGLDNVFRITEVDGIGSLAERGAWLDDRTFRYEERFVGQSTRGEIRLVFEGDEVEVTAKGTDSGYLETFRGRRK